MKEETASSDPTDVLIVTKKEESLRIDKLLSNRFDDKSRSYFQYLLENHLVLLNGKPVKKRVRPKEGDEIEVCFAATPEISLEAENIPLDILFEDSHIIAVNKPKGMVVHPAPGHYSHTFVNALIFHCKNLPNINDSVRPGIVHRLDKETSGVLIAAKTLEAHQKLIELFANRKMQKYYLAICIGKPKEGIFSAPIARHPVDRKRMTVHQEKGKESISEFTILSHENNLSLIRIKLHTGRTHQIRVHLKHMNCPILGDEIYGIKKTNETMKISSQLLHAYQLGFTHPITDQNIVIRAPLLEEMQTFIEKHFPTYSDGTKFLSEG